MGDLEKKLFRLERERIEKERLYRIMDRDLLETVEEVFDRPTLMALYDLVNDGVIGVMHGVVSSGKEARVYWAEDPKGRDLAVKIYLTMTAEFRRGIIKYIEGDPRFHRMRRHPRKLIYLWCSKEFRNLRLAYDAGVRVPKPIKAKSNILVMEFIGDPEVRGRPAPLLKDMPPKDPERALDTILDYIYKLYNKAELVHADLSEYNIMNRNEELVIIDWGSAVKKSHPMQAEFLERDVRNILRYFSKLGVDVPSLKEVLSWIVGS